MLGCLWAHAKAYRMVPATAGVVVLCAVMVVTGDRSVGLGGVPVRSTWFLLLGVGLFSALPLARSFGELERTFVRARASRSVRATWHVIATASALACAWPLSLDFGLAAWFVTLSALALLHSSVHPEATLLSVLALGGGTILLDHTAPAYPVSRAMETAGPGTVGVLYVLALAIYIAKPDVPVVRWQRVA